MLFRSEASKFNLDVSNLYEPKEISLLRNKINYNGGQTSHQDVKDANTYLSGDSEFSGIDFPRLQGTKYRAYANIKMANGKYWPYVYVDDGSGNRMRQARELPGQTNLQSAVLLIKEIDPTLAEKILIEK